MIERSIKKLNVNLNGYKILTEVGNNNYIYTPLIAAMTGAERVFVYTKDNKYFKATDAINDCKKLLIDLNLNHKVEFVTDINIPLIEADIITNSGFLRPLNQDKLSKIKSNAVIPLMYEAWEIRESDIDIEFCKKKKIKVAGTFENHESIKVFDAVSTLAVKLSLEAGFEVFQNRIAIWSNDHFGAKSKEGFLNMKAETVTIYSDAQKLMNDIENIDFIFICDYDEQRNYFGHEAIFNVDKILELNPSLGIIHLYGNIDNDLLKSKGMKVYPDKKGFAMIMTETLAYVGITPIINLQVAGFKVAEELLKNELTELSQAITF